MRNNAKMKPSDVKLTDLHLLSGRIVRILAMDGGTEEDLFGLQSIFSEHTDAEVSVVVDALVEFGTLVVLAASEDGNALYALSADVED